MLVGDQSTVPLTRISCNTVFSKSQNARKAGTLCSVKKDTNNFSSDFNLENYSFSFNTITECRNVY